MLSLTVGSTSDFEETNQELIILVHVNVLTITFFHIPLLTRISVPLNFHELQEIGPFGYYRLPNIETGQ